MSSPRDREAKPPMPAGLGHGKPVHPFAVTVEEPVAVSVHSDVVVRPRPDDRMRLCQTDTV